MDPLRQGRRGGKRAMRLALPALAPLVLTVPWLFARPVVGAGADDAAPPRYDRDIRPLLSERCFRCHGQDENKRRAKLRLDDLASKAKAHLAEVGRMVARTPANARARAGEELGLEFERRGLRFFDVTSGRRLA